MIKIQNLSKKFNNILDKWVLSKLNNLVLGMTASMEGYDTVKSCRLIKEFIEELSLWYVRRSRDRFKEEGQDKDYAGEILRVVLLSLSKAVAPILPFTAEFVFEKVKSKAKSPTRRGASRAQLEVKLAIETFFQVKRLLHFVTLNLRWLRQKHCYSNRFLNIIHLSTWLDYREANLQSAIHLL